VKHVDDTRLSLRTTACSRVSLLPVEAKFEHTFADRKTQVEELVLEIRHGNALTCCSHLISCSRRILLRFHKLLNNFGEEEGEHTESNIGPRLQWLIKGRVTARNHRMCTSFHFKYNNYLFKINSKGASKNTRTICSAKTSSARFNSGSFRCTRALSTPRRGSRSNK